ncbi:putative ceramide glucosyltransferase [Aspergillus chevalieri]|uniref:Ceramide glucosyltransferase n=1 Tax=Aspergillus chevalieri TaxID=182096 RepID=A0A7R7ZQC2_ASPCH|nr:uncharacterized protein ACHE_50677S [Aspergillus chevalieri]BCR89479.1 hypothetical protein ACHE_50677S [Aspergillus chevalieri]
MLKPTSQSKSSDVDGGFPWLDAVGWGCLIWYTTVQLVCVVGYYQIWKYFLQRPPKSSSTTATSHTPHVTAIRPIKGLEPHLYECLASTFYQDYPYGKLSVHFCVSSRTDPGYPTVQRVLTDFPDADARLFIEDEDPLLHPKNGDTPYALGPNPKIRNMSRSYREANGDIIWIIDCNVWVGPGVCGRMVNRLCGTGNTPGRKYKFVHHLPVAVDVTGAGSYREERQALLDGAYDGDAANREAVVAALPHKDSEAAGALAMGGGRLEELFLSSAHAKMYTAINTVLIAPCIVGKSNMFRRSHLDYLTASSPTNPHSRLPGIDYFSDNICEDHLIGDLLWKNRVKEEELGEPWGKHAMVFGDLAFQPVANMSLQAYLARRVRWQRVRKFTVLLATWVEPGTESILCSLYGAWGVTTTLAQHLQNKGIEWAPLLSTWTAFFAFFVLSMAAWIFVDWTLYIKLHSAKTVELDENTPPFAQPPSRKDSATRRPFLTWFAAWCGRELLALPIWFWAFFGGVTVTWRERRFRVGFDTKVREIESESKAPLEGSYSSGTRGYAKARRD